MANPANSFNGPLSSNIGGLVGRGGTIATTIAQDAVLTGAAMASGIVTINNTAAASSNATSTAAVIVAAFPSARSGDVVEFSVIPTAATVANTVTITAGAGVTLSGLAVMPGGVGSRWRISFTNATAGAEAVALARVG